MNKEVLSEKLQIRPREMIILAGGFGTRLRSIVADVPKPMAPINGVPFLGHLMKYWIGQGVERFILSVGYKSDVIINYFGASYHGAEIVYSPEDEPLGTGGGIKKAINKFDYTEDHILIANGDTWFEINIDSFLNVFKTDRLKFCVAVKIMRSNERYACLIMNTLGLITEFNSKGNRTNFINGGIYVVSKEFIKKELEKFPDKFSFEKEFLPILARRGLLHGVKSKNSFCDIGIPEDYLLCNNIINYYFSNKN